MSAAQEMAELRHETRALVEASRENSDTIGALSGLIEDFNDRVNDGLNNAANLTIDALSSLQTELFVLRYDLSQALGNHADAIRDHARAVGDLGNDYVAGQVVGGLFKMMGSTILSLGMIAAAKIIADGMTEKSAQDAVTKIDNAPGSSAGEPASEMKWGDPEI